MLEKLFLRPELTEVVAESVNSVIDESFFKRKTITDLYTSYFGITPAFGNLVFPSGVHACTHVEFIHKSLTLATALETYRKCFGTFDCDYRQLKACVDCLDAICAPKVLHTESYMFCHEGSMVYPTNRPWGQTISDSFVVSMNYLEYIMFRFRERFSENVLGKSHISINHYNYMIMADGEMGYVPIPLYVYSVFPK